VSDIFRDYSFGGQLREIRVARSETLRSFAKRTGLDPGNYSALESGRLPPPRNKKKCKELLQKLEVPEDKVNWLIGLAFNFHLGKLHGEWK
jgi:transcriptional regulator with XRE-family HTH domain